jgi:hypothetical protein
MVMMVKVVCGCCKTTFSARRADVNRGWGKFCSKSCKAKKQEARTGQYANIIHRVMRHQPALKPYTSIFDPGDDVDDRPMSQEELAMGGYGDADWDTPFHDGKL